MSPRLIALSEASSGKVAGSLKVRVKRGAEGRGTIEGKDPMFAVIKTGGKQYRVAANDKITIEKLPAEAGAAITFEEVLMVGDGDNATIGTPLVAGASVAGEIVEQTRGDKIFVFKKKRRKHYRRRAGHRQDLTVVRITDILTDGAKKAPKAAAKAKAEKEDVAVAPAAEVAAAEASTDAAPAAEAKKPAAKKAPKADPKASKE
jgi:large subunit ribosomal protein L21